MPAHSPPSYGAHGPHGASVCKGAVPANVTLGVISKTAADLEHGTHADIERMPMGYESLVGDMGSTLTWSGTPFDNSA